METLNPNWFLRVRLKTRQLLLLVALDEHRNIHRAAEALHMTQPAASKQIKDLEDMLDVRLFDRLPRGMQPTIYGDTMIRHARMALTSLSLAHDDVLALKAGQAGQVAVGAITAPALALLPPAIARVKQQAPLLRIGVHVQPSDVLMGMLQDGKLDFMVGRIAEGLEGLIYEELGDEPACVVARPAHPLQPRADLTLADIAGQPWILPPPASVMRHRFDLMFRRASLAPPGNVVDATDMLVVSALLQQTDSLHVMALDVARHYAAQNILRILPFDLPFKLDAFGLIRQQDHLLSPGADLLLRAVRHAAQEID